MGGAWQFLVSVNQVYVINMIKQLDHLETLRQKEITEKRSLVVIPEELIEFRDICIYDEIKRQNLKKQLTEGVVIGGVSLDEDERSVLRLNPKFAVLTRLEDEEVERDIEVSAVKLKYEIKRQEEIELMEAVEHDTLIEKKIRLDGSVIEKNETELNEARER